MLINQPSFYAQLMLLAVAIVWGMSYGVAKHALLFYPVLGGLAIRFCLTAIILLPALWRLPSDVRRNAVTSGVPLGLILLAIFVAETFGVSLTQAANAAFLISLRVVFTPFVEWLLLKNRPTRSALTAVILSLTWTWLITSGTQFSLNIGDGLILLAAILRAFMVTRTKQTTQQHSTPALTMTAVQTAVVGLGCLVLALILKYVQPNALPQLPTLPSFTQAGGFWLATGFLIVFCTLFAFFAQNYALQRTSPTKVSLLMGTEPLFGALFAVLALNEHLSWQAWLGGALIVGASWWALRK